MLECDGSKPGPLFTEIIKEQFLRLRDADRFWFENEENHLFTPAEVEAIKKYKMVRLLLLPLNNAFFLMCLCVCFQYDVIIAATSIPAWAIQKDVFFWRDGAYKNVD